MKRYLNNYVVILFICFLFSTLGCQNKTNIIDNGSLLMERAIHLDSIVCKYPRIQISDSLCCVADLQASSNYFHIYSFPDFKYIKSLGVKGNGHEEINTLIGFSFNSGIISALCGGASKILTYNVVTEEIKCFELPKGITPIEICSNQSEGWYVYSLNSDYAIYEVKSSGDVLPIMREPTHSSNSVAAEKNSVWQSVIAFNNNVLAYATSAGDYVSFLDKNNNYSIINSFEGNHGEPKIVVKHYNGYDTSGLNYIGYVDICCGEKYVYTLFRGEELFDKDSTDIENEVRVFDYNGKLIKKYGFEKSLDPSSFCVDEKNNKIYMVVPDEDKQIFVYSIDS